MKYRNTITGVECEFSSEVCGGPWELVAPAATAAAEPEEPKTPAKKKRTTK